MGGGSGVEMDELGGRGRGGWVWGCGGVEAE